jgi:hypothetical protein
MEKRRFGGSLEWVVSEEGWSNFPVRFPLKFQFRPGHCTIYSPVVNLVSFN